MMTDLERIRKLQGVLQETIDDINWMSAADDFAPKGKAHKGWLKIRKKVERYEKVLLGELR